MVEVLKKIAKKNDTIKKIALNISRQSELFKYFHMAPWYFVSKIKYKGKQKELSSNYQFEFGKNFPIIKDLYDNAGTAGLYLIQDLWAAKKISEKNEEFVHYDIGSRVDGFIAYILSQNRKVVMIDIRPLPYYIDDNLQFIQADATNLDSIRDNSIMSISALCSLEHFGLGRYGDPIDPMACFNAFDAMQRVLGEGGRAYISVPVGKQRIEFNAHRIFSPLTIINAFSKLKLAEFSIATNDCNFPIINNANPEDYNNEEYLFGLFEFVKPSYE